MTDEAATAEAPDSEEKAKKSKRLVRKIEGTVLTITEMETGESVSLDADTLSDEMQSRSMMHGLNQKIGDAAAGKIGEDALKAMKIVAEGVSAGNWAVRAPAAKSVSVSDINSALAVMTEEERAVLMDSFAKSGIDVESLGISK